MRNLNNRNLWLLCILAIGLVLAGCSSESAQSSGGEDEQPQAVTETPIEPTDELPTDIPGDDEVETEVPDEVDATASPADNEDETTTLPANITRSLIDELSAVEVAGEDEVLDCIQTARDAAERINFAEGDPIPANVLVSIDLEAVYKSWTEYPLKEVCNEASWGLFESTGAFDAPYNGSYWNIAE